jgi:hypothetical protein
MLPDIEPLRILRAELAQLAAGFVALLPNLVAALVVVALTWGLARYLARIEVRLLRHWQRRPALVAASRTLTVTLVWLAGLLVALALVFPGLSAANVVAGLGIGSLIVGLAFRDIFENYLAGILILLRKPMRIGDDILCEGVEGKVEPITIRDTYLRKRSGELVLLPNAFIYTNPTTVLTDRPLRRITLEVGVAYGTDHDGEGEAGGEELEEVHADRGAVELVEGGPAASSPASIRSRWRLIRGIRICRLIGAEEAMRAGERGEARIAGARARAASAKTIGDGEEIPGEDLADEGARRLGRQLDEDERREDEGEEGHAPRARARGGGPRLSPCRAPRQPLAALGRGLDVVADEIARRRVAPSSRRRPWPLAAAFFAGLPWSFSRPSSGRASSSSRLFFAVFFFGAFSAISASACSSVTASGSSSFGSVAFTFSHFTYGP